MVRNESQFIDTRPSLFSDMEMVCVLEGDRQRCRGVIWRPCVA